MNDWEKGFICGFTLAVVIDIRNYGIRTETKELWRCNYNSIARLRKAGVPEEDIELLKKHWKELNN